MPKQVDVLVRDISKDEHGRFINPNSEPQTISYKSYLMLSSADPTRFELLGEVEAIDTNGNVKLREGNPNLEAQHRTAISIQPQRSVVHVVSDGPTEREIAQQKEIDDLRAKLAQTQTAATPERKKPGRKAKVKAELEGATA